MWLREQQISKPRSRRLSQSQYRLSLSLSVSPPSYHRVQTCECFSSIQRLRQSEIGAIDGPGDRDPVLSFECHIFKQLSCEMTTISSVGWTGSGPLNPTKLSFCHRLSEIIIDTTLHQAESSFGCLFSYLLLIPYLLMKRK